MSVSPPRRERPAEGTWAGGLGRLGRTSLHLLLLAAVLWLVAWVYVRLQLVIVPVVAALFVAALLAPVSERLRRRGVPAGLAALATMLAFAVVVGGTLALLAPTVSDELSDLGTTVEEGVQEVLRWLSEGPLGVTEAEINRGIDSAVESVRENSGGLGRRVVTGAVLLAEIIAGLLLALVLVFFFLKDGPRIWGWVLDLVPERSRTDVDAIGRRGWGVLGGYLRGVAIIAVVDAVLIGLALVVLGVPLVVPLMVLTFFGAFLPLVGATVAGAVAALVALVTQGVVDALLVVAAIAVIQQVEGDLLYPFVVGRAIELHPIAILLGLTAGSVLAGLVGAVLAVPLAAVIWNGVVYLRRERAVTASAAPAGAPAPPSG